MKKIGSNQKLVSQTENKDKERSNSYSIPGTEKDGEAEGASSASMIKMTDLLTKTIMDGHR